MTITILVDNATFIDHYLLAEPGFSAYIEDDGLSMLFDLGYSDIFRSNAAKMKIDLSILDYLVFSHGHLDHTWGLDGLIRMYTELAFERFPSSKPIILAHPAIFSSVEDGGIPELGPLISETKLSRHFDLKLSAGPLAINDHWTFLGAVPRKNGFEGKLRFGRKEGETEDDPVADDSALVYRGKKGLVILTGCSHSGICNIVEYAKEVCGDDRVQDIIGGFHLLDPSEEQLTGTVDYFKNASIPRIHPCHCTDLRSKIALASAVQVAEIGVGSKLQFQ